MDKLIINHGERVTEHELGDQPVVIGRDPECDLFFADKKLSRHHARVERVGTRVRLVDLGSRNGTWVNEVRVEDRDLSPGDEVRLGGLLIHIERSEPARGREDEESTVFLGGNAQDDSGTVMLDAPARESLSRPPEPVKEMRELEVDTATIDRPAADDSSTLFLKEGALPPGPPPAEEGDETLKRPEPERTVVLPGQATQSPYDTGTVVFRGQADPALQEAATRLAAVAPEAVEARAPDEAEVSYASLSDSMSLPEPVHPLPGAGRSWALRFSLVAFGLALFAFLVLALPLLRIIRVASAEESEKRARVLVELLATANEQALGEGRTGDVVVERIAGEAGVRAAYVVSPVGEILAPADRAGEKLEIGGVDGLGDVRSPRTARADDGDGVFVQPISYRGRRVGVAVVRHRAAGTITGGATVALAFGTLLLLVAVTGSVLLAARMTVGPIEELRGDVDAVLEGRATRIPLERPYVELSRLAASVSRLSRKSPP